MSIPIPLERLRAAIAERGAQAYVLTVSDDARPHVVHGPVWWEGDRLVADVGKRSVANATARPSVSLLYPVRSADDYSLIVDGTAMVAADGALRLVITPAKGVLHRPAPAAEPSASGCAHDCVPLLPSDPRSRG